MYDAIGKGKNLYSAKKGGVLMEELLRETLLFDFYGELLTEKQKTIFELFHLQDLSLSEIGEEQGISRQAVRDQLKRTEAILQGYEEKLHLVERFLEQKHMVKRIKELAEEVEKQEGVLSPSCQKLAQIKQIANGILE